MPKIPEISPDSNLGQTPRFRPANAEDFGSGTAQALQRLGGTLEDVGQGVLDVHNQVVAHQAATSAQKELQDYDSYLRFGTRADGSQLDKDGNPVPQGTQLEAPPDPSTHAEKMQQKIDEVRTKYNSSFGFMEGKAGISFNQQFEPTANSILLHTKAQAIERMNQNIDANFRSDLDNRANTAVNADPLTRLNNEAQTETYIDSMVKSGVITPEEGYARKENFVHQVELGTIRSMLKAPIQRDPQGNIVGSGALDVVKAIDGGEFNRLKADELERQRNIAINQQHQNVVQEHEEQMWKDRAQEKAQKQNDDDANKRLTDLWAQGKLTPQSVASERNNLHPSAYRTWTKEAVGGAELPSNRDVETDLGLRAMNGGDEDFMGDLHDAADKHLINFDSYKSLRTLYSQAANFKFDPDMATGMKTIDKLMGGDAGMRLPEQKAATVNVKRGLVDWRQDHPDAGSAEVQAQVDSLVQRGSILDKMNMKTGLLAPLYSSVSKVDLMSGKAPPDTLQKAYDATVSAFKRGEISEKVLKKEKDGINQWDKLMPRAAP